MENKTLVVFHRCGGKSLNYPPNTVLTAQWAAENGARAVEYDVVACNDNGLYKIIVVEPKLLKQAGLDINNLQMQDVLKLDAGNSQYGFCKGPLLEEMLAAIDETKTGHQIHIKGSNPATIKTLLPELKNLKNYLVTSFDISILKQVKGVNNTIPTGWIVKPKQESGSEGLEDLTAAVTANSDTMS